MIITSTMNWEKESNKKTYTSFTVGKFNCLEGEGRKCPDNFSPFLLPTALKGWAIYYISN